MLGEISKNPVFVIGGAVGGLAIARELGKRGIDVYILSNDKKEVAFKSKYCKKRIKKSKKWSHQDLKKILKKIAKIETKRLVVYALSDTDVLSCSIIKEELCDDFHFVVGKKEAAKILVNKREFYQALDKKGIEHPKTFFPEDKDNIKKIGKEIEYPMFIRPEITPLFSKEFGYRKGFVANSYDELCSYYKLASSKKIKVMFQEIISGPADNSFQLETYFNKKFWPTGFFARQRLRIWPQNFGNTTLCVSIPLSKLDFERKKISGFLKNIEYTGLASAEFKKDARDGKLKLLEINARPWFHFWLAAKCGINILLTSYLDAIGEKIEYNQEYKTGIKSFRLDHDILASRNMFTTGELSISEWFRSLNGKKIEAYYDNNDPLPFFYKYMKGFVMHLKNKQMVKH